MSTKRREMDGKAPGSRICIIRHRDVYELPLRREAEALRDCGHLVDVICLREGAGPPTEVVDGVRLLRIPLERKKGSVLRYIFDYLSFFVLVSFRVTSLHLRHRYRAIQVNTMPDFLVFSTVVCRLLGAKIVLFMKEPSPELGWTLYRSRLLKAVLRLVEQVALKYAHVVITVTSDLKDTYRQRGAKAEKIHVVLNGPDPRHLLPLAEGAEGPEAGYFTILCHGAVEERYGHDTILEAVKIAGPSIPNLRVIILGTGSYADSLTRLIAELDLESCVEYRGWVPDEEVAKALKGTDIGIVAQKSSPYSNLVHTNKMYEYMIFGKPVIASRLKSVESYFDSESLRFFEPADPRSLAEAIEDLYRHPAKAESLAAAAFERCKKYGWENQRKIYTGVYEKLLGFPAAVLK